MNTLHKGDKMMVMMMIINNDITIYYYYYYYYYYYGRFENIIEYPARHYPFC